VILQLEPLSDTVGAAVHDVDRDRLANDAELPGAVVDALEEHGVLLFREIGVDDEELVTFGRHLGELVVRPGYAMPEINVITQDPGNPMAEYLRGNTQWHLDGALDRIPSKAGILSARVVSPGDSGTEFASTYAAYGDLSADEQARCERLRVVHAMEATLRGVYAEPTEEQLATWRKLPTREHPLVWQHRSRRKSLVVGATADHVVGMDVDEGRALLADLVERATRPERVIRHDWNVGDMVIWDNTGVLHRVTGHDPTSTRELHRATVVGDEPIE
jgi:alpha-ketoglutarate-dependent taurine dioxygenase